MGAGKGRHPAPKQGASVRIAGFSAIRKSEILNALSVEINFETEIICEALKQFGEGALCPVATVDKRRNNGEAQVSESSCGKEARRKGEPRIVQRGRWSAYGTICQ